MVDFLSSPVLFPSDMDSSKLTADPTFKLPESTNWADHDYYNTMIDKSMASLTHLIKLEPVKENDIHVYSSFINTTLSPKIASVLNQKPATCIPDHNIDNDYSQRLTLLTMAQSMAHAYTLALPPNSPGILHHQDNTAADEGQKQLRANLRGALDVVENDIQRNGQDSLYSFSQLPNGNVGESSFYQDDIGDDWSWREDFINVPDLVHSVCSSPSSHSLVDDQQPSTPVLLESGISSHLDDNCSPQQMDIEITGTLSSSSASLSLSNIPQQVHDKKRNKNFKNWMVKVKQTTSAMKQDCMKSVSNTSRKLRQWIKN
ncbi:hypothetical protein BCR42DRAFT_419779 [Absidia repens]|uniref:Uncharacterized protein n=1 Tax=Absidia repens TaxID=90262 RepID=A0A1X2IAD9_9FUNG|nr:hypothetical protein BCR42DRAFT_419779 [Absidia repens]